MVRSTSAAGLRASTMAFLMLMAAVAVFPSAEAAPPTRTVASDLVLVGAVPESVRGSEPFGGAPLKFCQPQANSELDDGCRIVNLETGSARARFQLFDVDSARGRPIVFEMVHRSNILYDGPAGFNWDFTYNKRFVELGNLSVVRYTGEGRTEVYLLDAAAGGYDSPKGYYDELSKTATGFKITDRFGNVEHYNLLGRLDELADRNGNNVLFQYDTSGRLERITDSHDRYVTITWHAHNRIASVNDFSGRTYGFTYNDAGDLTHLSAPSPNPGGGTVTLIFTYDSSHRMKSMRDFRGYIYGAISYDTLGRVTQQNDGAGKFTFSYDALSSSTTLVDPNGNKVQWVFSTLPVRSVARLEFSNRNIESSDPEVFVTTYFTNSHGEVIRKVLPRGNFWTFTYDEASADQKAQGNLLSRQLSSGTLPNPDGLAPLETTFTYETRYNQPKTVTSPRGNDPANVPANGGISSAARYTTVYFYDHEEAVLGDLNGDGVTTGTSGNLVRIQEPLANPAGNPQAAFSSQYENQQSVWTFQYNGKGQTTSLRDPRGYVTTFEYYVSNGIAGDAADAEGLLYRQCEDVGSGTDPHTGSSHLNLCTLRSYDLRGNVVGFIDGRGNQETSEFSAWDFLTLHEAPAPYGYQTVYTYDANGNRLSEKIDNVVPDPSTGANVLVTGHPQVVNTWTYTPMDAISAEKRDAWRPSSAPSSSEPTVIETRYFYDLNRNLVLVQYPVAVAGSQASNFVSYVYDERNLMHTMTRAGTTSEFSSLAAHAHISLAGLPTSPDAATTLIQYDENGNKGLERGPRGYSTTYGYDAFDRNNATSDAYGNRHAMVFDAESNVIRKTTTGATGGQGPGGDANPNNHGVDFRRLAEETFAFDERGRNYRVDQLVFSYTSTSAAAPARSTSLVESDATGNAVATINPKGAKTAFLFDGAGRLVQQTDAKGNVQKSIYDANGNALIVDSIDRTSSTATTTYRTYNVYDELNRLVRTTEPQGETWRFKYDSQDGLVFKTDPNGALISDPLGLYSGLINDDGNRETLTNDAAGRVWKVSRQMWSGTPGSSTLTGSIAWENHWDANGRQVKSVDPRGKVTSYAHDAHDRQTQTVEPDGTTRTTSYDRAGNPVLVIDGKTNRLASTFDKLNRIIVKSASTSGGSALEEANYAYDGLSRIVLAAYSGPNNDRVETVREYDSQSNLISEIVNDCRVCAQYDELNNVEMLTYPNGRELSVLYDELGRLVQIHDSDGTMLMSNTYFGLRGIASTQYANGIIEQQTYDSGGELATLAFPAQGLQFDYGLDRMDQATQVNHVHQPALSQSLTYDSTGRLTLAERGKTSTLALAVASSGPAAKETWSLDDAGNWASWTREDASGTTTETRSHNDANQIVSTSIVPPGVILHDGNGNLVRDNQFEYTWDSNDLLQQVRDLSGNSVAEFDYDAFGRRVAKTVYVAGVPHTTSYCWFAGQILEEREVVPPVAIDLVPIVQHLLDVPFRQFVYGAYPDQPIVIDTNMDGDNSAQGPGDKRLVPLKDRQFSVVALTSTTGAIVEGYAYDSYGRHVLYLPGANGVVEYGGDDLMIPDGASTENEYLFTGRQRDAETGLYYYRARYYDPEVGRFISRDYGLLVGDPAGLNLYQYTSSDPVNHVDPSGHYGLFIEGLSVPGIGYQDWKCTKKVWKVCVSGKFVDASGLRDLAKNAEVKRHLGTTSVSGPYKSGFGQGAFACQAMAYKAASPSTPTVFVGHSLGAGAAMGIADKMVQWGTGHPLDFTALMGTGCGVVLGMAAFRDGPPPWRVELLVSEDRFGGSYGTSDQWHVKPVNVEKALHYAAESRCGGIRGWSHITGFETVADPKGNNRWEGTTHCNIHREVYPSVLEKIKSA